VRTSEVKPFVDAVGVGARYSAQEVVDLVGKALESQGLQGRSTRQGFVKRAALAGGGVAGLGLFGLTESAAAATDADVLAFGNAAVGAERIAVAFYSNAIGDSSPFSAPSDKAKGTLLNAAHRDYFEAARNQEASHLATLQSLGLSFPFSTFDFPAGTFASAKAMLAMGEQLENVFIGAYLGAVKAGASTGTSLEPVGCQNAPLSSTTCRFVGETKLTHPTRPRVCFANVPRPRRRAGGCCASPRLLR
jgi:hypothetical protein